MAQSLKESFCYSVLFTGRRQTSRCFPYATLGLCKDEDVMGVGERKKRGIGGKKMKSREKREKQRYK